MFCDKCGTAVQADQRFCSRCGREFTGTMVIGHPRRGRVQEHIRLLGILWLALSAFNAMGAAVLFTLSNTLFLHLHEGSGPPPWLHPFLSFIAVIIVAKALAGVLVGWGLLHREPWARIVTIILAFLALFNVPFGTALGIYTLWVLLPAGSDVEYENEVRSVAA
jgi:predicted nucleic acid-binding Zn ribbon protein